MDIQIKTLDEIQAAARAFTQAIGSHRIIAFHAPMGAGKTTFIRAICQELGVKETVTSPTFAIINEYEAADGSIYHFDFYRLRRIEEAYDIGLDDYLYSGHLCLIEWPELIQDLLPPETLHVTIHANPADDSRIISLS